MKARLAAPATGSPAPRAAGSATVPRLASVIGNRATRERVAGTTELGRPALPRAARVQLTFSTGRAGGGPASHPARAHGGGLGAAAVHASAARGVATSWSALPHAGLIQRAFGRHDLSAVQAHTGSDAAASARAMGAEAYATGNHVVLGDGATDLHTVAHEAAHVVQQRAGVQLKGGVGEADDPYERHADEVADRVVQGKSAESLLDAMGPARGAAPADSVQCQPKKPRRTETRILGEMASDTGSLDAGHSDALIDKMGKDQTFKRARAIAAQIEAASENLVSRLPDEKDRKAVRKAINDYVSDSTPIQTHARDNPDDPNQAVQALDAALEMIQEQIARIGASTDRIVYRSVSYSDVTEIPYDRESTAGPVIRVGDMVKDPGFLSTSEHRQFVIGKEQKKQPPALLQLAIHGTSGAPIAIGIYSNSNLKARYKLDRARENRLTQLWKKVFGAGPRAGQAEVLFPRNTVFEVKHIERDRTTVSVVLEEVTGWHGDVKNMKDGAPLR